MFRWYQRAAKCYVYLSDISIPDEIADAQSFRITWAEAFRQSQWFKRGWTLQELLAPRNVEFFSTEGKRLGSRVSLEWEIHQITTIPVEVLRGQSIAECSVEERMRWASTRITTLREDKVYCLLGIFGVFLPLIYGEGEENATRRLREEIANVQAWQGEGDSHDLSVSLSLPFPRNNRFVGREDQLQSLKQVLLSPNVQSRMTIYGLGGCGKSALSLEFAYHALVERATDLIFWVPAMSRESFELAYGEIATRLRIPGSTENNADIKELVKNALSAEKVGRWLMIVDNADDPTVLSETAQGDSRSAPLGDFLPRSHQGAILFTTRSRKAAMSLTPDHVLQLKDMNQEEARQLLTERITEKALIDDSVAVDQLLGILAYLPLAIVQAAAFINNNEISVSEYVSMFEHPDGETELFSEQFVDPSRYQGMDSTVAKTWHISFNQIRRQDPLAAKYLAFIGCIDRINIPQSLLAPAASKVQQTKALGTLTSYAFITERQQVIKDGRREKFFDMHRLVHMALVMWLHEHKEWTSWVRIAIFWLIDVLPAIGHEGWQVWMPYLAHATHLAKYEDVVDEETRASLLHRIGDRQLSLGRYAAAEGPFIQAVSLRKEFWGPEHPFTLHTQGGLAQVLRNQGKYQEAEVMYKQTVSSMESVLGPKHADTLANMINLASALHSQDKYEEAEVITRQTLPGMEDVLGIEHPHTLISMNNLALILNAQGKYKEAEAIARQTLATKESVLGSDHPFTITGVDTLGSVLFNLKRYEEAEVLYRRALVGFENAIGSEHPDTLSCMHNLAMFYHSQETFSAAIEIYQRVVDGRKKVLGVHHPLTQASLENYELALQHKEVK